MAASIASVFLLAGMGSVMYIARQVAYSPSDSIQRSSAAMVVNQICDELRYATLVLQQTPQILEFVVADRNSDGTAEKIRYQWSGTLGDPLVKTVNGGTGVNVLPSVNSFVITLQQTPKTTTFTTTNDSAETLLLSNTTVQSASYRDIDVNDAMAQVIRSHVVHLGPIQRSVLERHEDVISTAAPMVRRPKLLNVQIRYSGDPNDQPTSNVLGQVAISGIRDRHRLEHRDLCQPDQGAVAQSQLQHGFLSVERGGQGRQNRVQRQFRNRHYRFDRWRRFLAAHDHAANVGTALRHLHHARNVLQRHPKLRFKCSYRASIG